MEIDITEISPEEANNISFRSSHKWDMEGITQFTQELVEKFTGKIVRLPIEQFYKQFYSGEKDINHKSYYCKKKIQKVLTDLNINCKVNSTKKWDGVLVLQL